MFTAVTADLCASFKLSLHDDCSHYWFVEVTLGSDYMIIVAMTGICYLSENIVI